MTTLELLVLASVGGLLSLDSVTLGQFMVSRPLVAATLAGAFCGIPAEGFLIGVTLEMLAMETMPFGASRYLEWSSGAVVATAIVAHAASDEVSIFLGAIVAAIMTAWIAGSSLILLRRINGRNVAVNRSAFQRGSSAAIASVQLTGLALDFLRGATVVGACLALAMPATTWFAIRAADSGAFERSVVVAVPAAIAMAATWRMFGSGSRRRLLVGAGALIGAALVVVQ